MTRDVLVFTPVYRLEPEAVEGVAGLVWPGPLSWLLQRDNPTESGRENILHQYIRAREVFLAGRYDAMLVVESDIIVPPDTLTRLAALEADVAYGVYRFRNTQIINVFERYPGNPRNEGESLSIHPALLADAVAKGAVPCSGGGLGCALIQRHVLEVIPFRMEETAHCDTYFNRDVMHAGLSQRADMGVVCGHVSEHGEIQWPHLEAIA
jgi:hypothetical protein